MATNWSGGIVPANSDDAIIVTSDAAGRLVTYDYAPGVTLGSLSLSSAAVLGAGTDSMTQATNAIGASNELIGIGLASGFAGSGVYTQSGGTNTVNGALHLGFNATGRGTYTLSNTGVINLNGTFFDGNNGIGTFTQTGGTINGTPTVYLGFNASGKGTYTLNGASATMSAGFLSIGENGAGTMLHSAGTASLSGALFIGDQSTGTGLYQLSGGTLLVVGSSDNEFIGNSGTGAFTQTGGTHILSGPANSTPSGSMSIGGIGGVGTYSLSGATSVLSVQNIENIGEGGLGTFIHNGGTNTCTGLFVGDLSAGTYLMSGNGTLNAAVTDGSGNQSFLDVGGSGAGTFLQSGGTVNIGTPLSVLPQLTGQLAIGGGGTTGFGYYKLSAGTVNVHQGLMEVGGFNDGAGTFEQTAGKVTVDGLLLIGTTTGNSGAGTYLLSGGTLSVNPITVLDSSDSNPILLDGAFVTTGGTLIGGASGGFFTGKLTQQGGTIGGVLRNQGTFVYQGGSFTGQLINQGTFVLNGITFAPPQTITNDDLGAINATGTIASGVINRGSINPTGGALFVSSVTNNGAINVAASTSFNSGFVDNFGRVVVSGGELVGTGTISNNATGISGGGVISGGGTVQLNITQNGGILRADIPVHPLVITTPIVISDPTSQIVVAPNSAMSLQSPLANSALIVMQGPGAALSGATITNTGTIRGAGDIANQIINNGILRAETGALNLTSPNDGNFSGQIQAGGGSTVRFTHGMQLNNAMISLTGGEFDNGSGSLTNNGAILGRGTLRTAAAGLTNNGSIILSGGASDVFGAVTNHGQITVTGNGAATFYDPFTNSTGGSMSITLGSTAVFLGPVSGLSSFVAGAGGGGVKDFEGIASGGGINTVNGSTIIGPAGNLTFTTLRDDTAQILGRASAVPNGTAAGTIRVNTLLIAGNTNAWTGKLDLADNDLIIDYTGTSPLATVQNQIKSGSAAGAWNGNGITSSSAAAASSSAHKTALGYAEASALGLTTFSGQSVDSTSLLIRYTYAGDANLDGVVDTLDFNSLAASFGGTGKGWSQADFNYDGVVDTLDFNNLAANFGQSLAPSEALGARVPEPGAAMAAIAGAVAVFARRSRKRGR